jgi:FKBP-type peptidyl-prolyl cis-trans isomerase
MKKITFAIGALLLTAAGSYAQNFKTTPHGLEYYIAKDAPGTQTAKIGDHVEMHITTHVKTNSGVDSVLFDSRRINNNQPVPFQLQPPQFNGDLAEGFTMMTAGDSAVFRVPVDSMQKNSPQPLPEWMPKGAKIQYEIKLVSVKTQEQMQKDQQEHEGKQKATDDKLLQEYFKKNNIKDVKKTASGLYYKITAPGTGEFPKNGQNVTVNYTGKTTDGNAFDSNVDPKFQHVQPFSFPLGQGRVIKGWDEGVALIKKGGKATLYIPSGLAYGERSPSPSIPADAILIFDVEVTDVQ